MCVCLWDCDDKRIEIFCLSWIGTIRVLTKLFGNAHSIGDWFVHEWKREKFTINKILGKFIFSGAMHFLSLSLLWKFNRVDSMFISALFSYRMRIAHDLHGTVVTFLLLVIWSSGYEKTLNNWRFHIKRGLSVQRVCVFVPYTV